MIIKFLGNSSLFFNLYGNEFLCNNSTGQKNCSFRIIKGLLEPGGQCHPSQDFGRSVNPIATGGHMKSTTLHTTRPPTRTFRPSLGPAFLEYLKIPLSLENVRHSEPTSITRSPTTSPHIEHIMSPVIRKRMNY